MKNKNVAAEVVAVEATPAVSTTPIVKPTPVEDRLYEPANKEAALVFKGKQRQIVYNILMLATKPLTISDVAATAEEQGLKAVGGVEPSVRYHLHHLTKDQIAVVTNPTFILE